MYFQVLFFVTTTLLSALLSTAVVITSSDGTDIFATAAGNPHNPSLVFVHGFALSGIVFDNLFHNKYLLAHFYLVAYDLRGHGRSGKPDSADAYTSQLFADDFDAVRTTFKLNSSILIGWSYGASVASDIFTYLEPGVISGFVSAAGIPYLGLTDANTPLSLTYVPGMLSTDDVTLSVSSKLAFVESCFANPDEVPIEVMWSWLGATNIQFPAISNLLLARTQDVTQLYAAGAAGLPLLIIYGTADAVLQDASIASQVQPHFTNAQIQTIQGAGHALFYDKEAAFVNALFQFATSIGDPFPSRRRV
ncbi:alpha/beta-hydrolase [Pholiota conissans]|uniref:Alpha/beta-hydrolase n=1 Tax=Pholiota conissans TaxID=109636 RepID=A0A9P6D1T3_9AGAR|nr:alpha/beta-hydrolase [Pholiota conissans]